MGCLTSGLTLDCESGNINALGSIARVFLYNPEDVATLTVAAGIVTVFTLTAITGFIYEVDMKREAGNIDVNGEGNGYKLVNTLDANLVIPRRDVAKFIWLENLASCVCGVGIIWIDATGERFLWNYLPSAPVDAYKVFYASDAAVSGTTMDDDNEITLVLTARSPYKPLGLDPSIDLDALLPA